MQTVHKTRDDNGKRAERHLVGDTPEGGDFLLSRELYALSVEGDVACTIILFVVVV